MGGAVSDLKTLWLVQKPDGKVKAYKEPPSKIDSLQLAITFRGEIVGVTHGGFYSVPIEENDL